MKQIVNACRVSPGERVELKERPARIEPVFGTKDEYRSLLEAHVARLSKQQALLYTGQSHAVLLILQAMDAAGKDGCVKHVMSGINPQGCRVTSFGRPSPLELRHDFLWRTTLALPERGMIGIHNRSYYEEVVTVRVHPQLLAAQGLDAGSGDDFWDERFRSITEHERHLHGNGTRIVKVFLNVSKDEQKKRLLERIDTPEKNWKIEQADIAERQYWPQYRKAYEACMRTTSVGHAPWYVVPADDKLMARLIVSQLLGDALDDLNLKPPRMPAKRRDELAAMRVELEKE